jgi:hypothetical protein
MTECTICCEECDDNAQELPCGHKFHASCLVPWLWSNSSCPNCRFTESHRAQATSTDIQNLVVEMQQQHVEHQRRLNVKLQRAKKKDASKILIRQVEKYKKCKDTLNITRKDLRTKETILRQHNKTLNQKLNAVYSDYLKEFNKIKRDYKSNMKNDKDEYRKIRSKFLYTQKNMMTIQDRIIQMED